MDYNNSMINFSDTGYEIQDMSIEIILNSQFLISILLPHLYGLCRKYYTLQTLGQS